MRRPLAPEDAKLWSLVTATVRPTGERRAESHEAALQSVPAPELTRSSKSSRRPIATIPDPPALMAPLATVATLRTRSPEDIEPRRRRRISRSREPIGARLDLHGLDQTKAEAAVFHFIRRAHEGGMRAVLIITGKGTLGDGILRRRTPEWLSDPGIRPLIAGFSFADRHHGGEGALYVALKRGGR